MWLRSFLVVFCFAVLALSLSACSSSLSEAAIKEMLAENTGDFMPKPDEEITLIEITKRDANKETKAEEVWFTVHSSDTEAEYIRYFIAGFKLYDKGGWQYELAVADPKEKMSATPIAGVNDDAVKELVNTQGLKTAIVIGDDNWMANGQSIKSITVGKHKTQLAQKKDTVTVAIVLEDIVQQAEGEVELVFTYEDGWKYEDYSVSKPFTALPIAGTEKDLTADDFVALVINQNNLHFAGQTVTLSSAEISDVTLESSTSTNKGTQQSYVYSFKVSKGAGRAVFAVTAQVDYWYSNGWQTPDFYFTKTELTALNLTGAWTGTAKGSTINGLWDGSWEGIQIAFEITEDGDLLDGIPVTMISPNATALMSMAVNPTRLEVSFTFTEWTGTEPTNQPGGRVLSLPTFTATIDINDFAVFKNGNIDALRDVRLTVQPLSANASTS